MKVFISSDIEGTAGIVHWDETQAGRDERWYPYFCGQMTREVAAACQGAVDAGATDILVKDAHNSGRNIDPAGLPRQARLNRGWSGDLLCMVAGLTSDFDALAFTGYHTPAYSSGNPMAHTMFTGVSELCINGARASEFTIHSYAAGMLGVPVVFVSGDAVLCAHAKDFLPAITAVPVTEGEGDSATALHPEVAEENIREGMHSALTGDLEACRVVLPEHFQVQVTYREHQVARSKGQYPGAVQMDERTIAFEHWDYNEVLRFFHFVL